MNNVQLIGRLTKDVELKQTTSGIEVVQFTLAVNRSYKNPQGEYDADFIRCVAYRKTAELIARYFQKGSQLGLDGRIQTGSYENQQGERIYTTDIIVNQIYFIGNANQRTQEPTKTSGNMSDFGANTRYSDNVPDFISDDDLPF